MRKGRLTVTVKLKGERGEVELTYDQDIGSNPNGKKIRQDCIDDAVAAYKELEEVND